MAKALLGALPLLAFPGASSAKPEAAFPAQAFDENGFALAMPEVPLAFPRDHGSHPNFKSEWWYVTGHLEAASGGAAYGFQITFFRSAAAASPGGVADEGASEQMYLAHAALFDKRTGQFHHEERLNNGLWNADAAVGNLDVYNGNWYLRMTDPHAEKMVTRFSLAELGSLKLELLPLKPRTLFGDRGYSKKGDERGAASYYISFTRLEVRGEVIIDGQPFPVSGLAWMDHEFSSSQLSSDQVGWNWTSLMLDDNTEVMAYVLRRQDGSPDPHSRLTVINRAGEKRVFDSNSFTWAPQRYWESPHSGTRYPVEHLLTWKDGDQSRRVLVRPFGDEQELQGKIGSFVYWEGACRAFDESGQPIGLGYTELTGYDESLQGKF